MSEETKPTEPSQQEPSEAPAGDKGDRADVVPYNVREKINAQAKTIEELQRKLEAQAKDVESKRMAELKAKEQHKEIAEQVTAQLEALRSEYDSYKSRAARDAAATTLRYELRSLGIVDDFAIRGYVSAYDDLEPTERPEPSAWLEDLRKKNPERFAGPAPVGKPSGSAGPVSQASASASLEDRLKSSDPAVRMAALKEKFRADTGFAIN